MHIVYWLKDDIIPDGIKDSYASVFPSSKIHRIDAGHMWNHDDSALDELLTLLPQAQFSFRRECDTLDTFMCSAFYFLRYPDAHNPDELIRKELADKMFPIEFYSWWKEHTVGHLLYSRFIHKFLYDQGYLSSPEPFSKLVHQWMVLGADGRKMWKRYNNWVDPLQVVDKYWADAVRTYMMFMWPVESDKPWSDTALNGVYKFLKRIERLLETWGDISFEQDDDVESLFHETIKWMTYDLENLKFNTAVSKLMILTNKVYERKAITKDQLKMLAQLIAPFAPQLAENLWIWLEETTDVHFSHWPVYDESKIQAKHIVLPIQINWKVRWKTEISAGLTESEVLEIAQWIENVAKWIDGKEIKKVIWIQDKILNLIVA